MNRLRRTPVSLAGTEGLALPIVRACADAARRDGWAYRDFLAWLRSATASGGYWSFLDAVEDRFEVVR